MVGGLPGGPQPAEAIGGTLFMHGGGVLSSPLMGEFIELCDRPDGRLLIIPSAAADEQIDEFQIIDHWDGRGFAGVGVLHTRSREEADSEAFVAPLRKASAVWIGGGESARLEASYCGTRVGDELRALLARGGVIGGTDAGAAVMGSAMIRQGSAGAEMGQGFGLIEGAVVAENFITRNREPLLLKLLGECPGTVGYGVNDGTALVLRGRSLSVVGRSSVTTCLAASKARKARVEPRLAPGRGDHIALSRAAIARAAAIEFPRAKPVATSVIKGSVIAFGGGATTKGGLEWFVDRAGGKGARIVVIYTAMGEFPSMPKHWRRLWDSVGATNVRLLHAADREVANSDEFVKQIDAAGGVWFTGGRQWRLVDRYFGTESHVAIDRVLERGGVVGGTSAGATIVGDYLVRGDPLTSRTMMQEGYEQGLGLVPGVAIDQHFSQRGRFRDMQALKRRYPQLMGIGIDEGTAVAFEGKGIEVFGRGAVYLYPVGGGRIELEHEGRMELAP